MGALHTSQFGRKLQAEVTGKYFVREEHLHNRNDPDGVARKYELYTRKDDKWQASLVMQPLPGCCGVALFYNLVGEADKVAILVNASYAAAQKARFGLALLTLRSESAIIPKLDATATPFLNGKTDNSVSMVVKVLPQTPRERRTRDTDGE